MWRAKFFLYLMDKTNSTKVLKNIRYVCFVQLFSTYNLHKYVYREGKDKRFHYTVCTRNCRMYAKCNFSSVKSFSTKLPTFVTCWNLLKGKQVCTIGYLRAKSWMAKGENWNWVFYNTILKRHTLFPTFHLHTWRHRILSNVYTLFIS